MRQINGRIFIIVIVCLILILFIFHEAGEKSVSNIYLIPAGTFSPFNWADEKPVNLTEINSTAIAVALTDSRIRTYLTYDGSYEIVYVGPAQYELDNAVFNVTGVEIETPNDLYHVYVNVTNKTVDHIWSQPQRKPVFHS
jgi:hypothetical protein